MGQKEVSMIRKSFQNIGNLFTNENREKDIQRSRKELVMKTNGKKRIFALLMCAMMIISSMSVWAGYGSKVIGGTSSDRATCELYLSSSLGQAFTTPDSSGTVVSTAIAVLCSNKQTYSSSGSSSASRSVSGAVSAVSTHQAGPYYGTLDILV